LIAFFSERAAVSAAGLGLIIPGIHILKLVPVALASHRALRNVRFEYSPARPPQLLFCLSNAPAQSLGFSLGRPAHRGVPGATASSHQWFWSGKPQRGHAGNPPAAAGMLQHPSRRWGRPAITCHHVRHRRPWHVLSCMLGVEKKARDFSTRSVSCSAPCKKTHPKTPPREWRSLVPGFRCCCGKQAKLPP